MTKTGRLVRVRDAGRFAAHAAAAADPEIITAAIKIAFDDLYSLTIRGERTAAAGAAAVVSEQALLLASIAAVSSAQADGKIRLLTIVTRWSLSRDPRLMAVLQASVHLEQCRWGIDAGA